MVNLTRIYTRTGDDGTTALGDFSRTDKNDARLRAYADVDEANASLGVALTLGSPPPDVAAVLARVQNELFDVGADLCTPIAADDKRLRIGQAYIDRLEADCDRFNQDLKPLRSFVLPGGTPGGALLHQARTVTRRAERLAWVAIREHGDNVNATTAKYLNRLSDLLFILARSVNRGHEVEWKPGGQH
ncbi:MAG: cob(I)yrinic acid a,c-diamide adenosyltransferase [Candidatus Nanopelagicales bacterium]|nr:cob(I)yrinic acid a,c-diamide adenosyltransferase [Candidatus Nanopelagicales bacterium]MDZ4249101.1 cob(I)yrinic acid a,c-diamide adenosyltransferase [Candidatus Nanopelagicales bacterium]